MSVRHSPVGPIVETVITDSTAVSCASGGGASWTILGGSTGAPGSAGTVALLPGYYLIRAEWFLNAVTVAGGRILTIINGVNVGGDRDGRTPGGILYMMTSGGWVLHPGGNMTYQMTFGPESGSTTTFGVAGDDRWDRRLTITGPFPVNSR